MPALARTLQGLIRAKGEALGSAASWKAEAESWKIAATDAVRAWRHIENNAQKQNEAQTHRTLTQTGRVILNETGNRGQCYGRIYLFSGASA